MHALLVSLALLGQVGAEIPPAPAAELSSRSSPKSAEEMRNWMLAQLIVDLAFDTKKVADVERMLASMNERQLQTLTDVYTERAAKRELAEKLPPEAAKQQALDQAKLNLQQAEAYRDFLKREYDRRILQGQMEQNLVRQNIANNQLLMYRTNFGWGNTPLGYGGLGYGVMNYGGWGYGAPAFGPPIYGGWGYGTW